MAPSAIKVESRHKGGAIFISYRRSDSSGYVGRIREAFARKFKKRDVFLDLEIGPGTNFVDAIHRALSTSSLLLVIIGPEWLRALDADGRSRLSDPEDYVRFEIQAAIRQGLRVIPVLVGGARMPSPDELPEGLQDFAKFQAFELSNTRWDYDLTRLVAVIRPIVDPRFLVRRVCLGLAAVVALIGGVIVASQIMQNSRLDHAIEVARSGKVDEGLEMLKGVEGSKMPGRTNPKLYLYEAEIYMMKGDAFYQQEAAEKALAAARGSNYVEGQAKGFACDAKFKLGRPDEALQDCKDAEEASARAGDPKGQVRALNFKANILSRSPKPEDALPPYRQAMAIAQAGADAKDEEFSIDQYGALFNIGLILSDSDAKADQEQATRDIENAKQGFEHLGKQGEISNLYNLLGAFSLDHGKIDAARDYFQKALDLAIQAKDRNREAQARLNLGLILELTGSLDAAGKQLDDARKIYEELSNNSETGDIAEVKNNLGDIYLQQARYDDAGKSYQDAERIRAHLHQSGPQALSSACLVNLDLQQGKSTISELLNRIDDAIQRAKEASDSYSQSFANVIKARVLLPTDKRAAEEAAKNALKLAGDNQADNTFSANIILAEVEAMNGHTDPAVAKLKKLENSANQDQNVLQGLEAQLAYLKLLKQSGQPQQRNEAQVLLGKFETDARNRGYKLLAAKARAVLGGST